MNKSNHLRFFRSALVITGMILAFNSFGATIARASDSSTTSTSPAGDTIAPSVTPLPSNLLYNGEPAASSPMAVSSWGAGTGDFVDYAGLPSGRQALKVTTYGPYEGVLLTFNSPGLLGNVQADRTRYLVLHVATTAPTVSSSDAPETSLLHLAQLPAGAPQPADSGATDNAPQIQSLRLVLNLTNGLSLDTIRVLPPVDPLSPWINVGIPLTNLPLTDSQVKQAQLQSIMVAGDKTATFYISQISLVSDSTPIKAVIEGTRDADQGTTQTYTAHALGGASTLSYTWKFGDDKSTPSGPVVSHTFATAGSFKVSVTVLDIDELKTGVVTTTTVHVEGQ